MLNEEEYLELLEDAFNFYKNQASELLDNENEDMKENDEQFFIRSVLINKEKRVVSVTFADGETKIIKCHPDDEFDAYIGVSLAISEYIFTSKNQFHKYVNETARVIPEKQNKNKKTSNK